MSAHYGTFLLIVALITCALLNVSYIAFEIAELRSKNSELLSRITEMQSGLLTMQQSKNKLEMRVNSWMNWNSDPYIGSKSDESLCKDRSDLSAYGCSEGEGGCAGGYDHEICLDDLLPNRAGNCIIYDFGIREDPEFGETLLNPPFNCKIFAFDPSPITKAWYENEESESSSKLRNNPNYNLFHFGAGGVNGNLKLNEYNWGQVSIIRFPSALQRNCDDSDPNATHCRTLHGSTIHNSFDLPVRTLGSIMSELGHDHIDVLKLDVEGSEYMFLEEAIESGSLEKVQQVTVEWHHFDFDARYGGGSSPGINAIVASMKKIGLKQFYTDCDYGGWQSNDREFWERGYPVRYNLASFLRVDPE